MGLPKVTVNITNGALGTSPANEDGVSGLVVTATAVTGLSLATPTLINSLKDAEDLGLTATATAFAHRQIKGFYDGYNLITGSQVAPLYLMTLVNTATLTNMADKDVATGAIKLLDYAAGKIRLLGLGRSPGVYAPTITEGIDPDSLTALPKAQILGNTYAAAAKPLRILIEGRMFLFANLGSLADLRTHSENRAGIVLGSSLNDGSADVGFALGVAAALRVQQNIGRVKNGPLLPISNAYIGDTAVKSFASLDTIHDKGYMFYRYFPNRDGYYFNDDPMAAATSDDYSQLGRGRVIDKAHRITYRVYTNEINDDFVAETGGKLSEGTITYLESQIETAVLREMEGEISNFRCVIDPAQNVVSTNKVKIKGKIRPRGYFKDIDVDLGFEL
ncbi:MAG: DUF2586 family protein [Flavipsychrobacter sp.]